MDLLFPPFLHSHKRRLINANSVKVISGKHIFYFSAWKFSICINVYIVFNLLFKHSRFRSKLCASSLAPNESSVIDKMACSYFFKAARNSPESTEIVKNAMEKKPKRPPKYLSKHLYNIKIKNRFSFAR